MEIKNVSSDSHDVLDAVTPVAIRKIAEALLAIADTEKVWSSRDMIVHAKQVIGPLAELDAPLLTELIKAADHADEVKFDLALFGFGTDGDEVRQ